jgi:glucosamine--fructose-6-phosphate aminotransferase (isomerizing)
MLKDICQTPAVLQAVLASRLSQGAVEIPELSKPFPSEHCFSGKTPLEVMAACQAKDGSFENKITIIGCGTSYHVAVLAEYLIEHIARVPVEVAYASEYRYKPLVHRKGDVLIAISSSGKTTDTVESVKHLQASGAEVMTVAVVNDGNGLPGKDDTSLGELCDVCIGTCAGPELGIASTKVFSASALAFVLLAIAMGQQTGQLEEDARKDILSKLEKVPSQISTVIRREASQMTAEGDASPKQLKIGECRLWDIGLQNVLASNFIYLGRGFNFAVALEGAMKCKEVAYIHAEGYPAAEMKHGPIALIDQFMPVVVIAPRADQCFSKIKSNIEEVQTRSGSVIAITEENEENPDEPVELETGDKACEHVIKVPGTHEFLMPLIAAIPVQLLAYRMGHLRGYDVDNPRGLVKVAE